MKKMLITIAAILLVLITTTFGQNIWMAAFVIPNLLPENKTRPLELATTTPQIKNVKIRYKDSILDADLYLPSGPDHPRKILLVIHGANEKGKDDPRIVNFGNTFARAGITTLIPTFPNISREKFTPEATDEIKTAYEWLTEEFPEKKSGMAAFSVAAGPMFIAAADESIKDKVDYLISFGGYYELKEVLRNVTTGQNRDPFGHELISQQYAKLFGADEPLNNFLSNTDPQKFDELFEQLSPDIKQFISDLSPAQFLTAIKAEKIFVAHSDPDFIVPVAESVRLHQAFGNKSDLTILKSFSHVNVQFPRPTIKNLDSFYIPEAGKLYSLIFKILNY